MNAKQKTIFELKTTFEGSKISVSDCGKFIQVHCSLVTHDCKSRLVNLFRVGPRGGLTIIKQEFTSSDIAYHNQDN